MSKFSNKLSKAELERLALLVEECAEVIHIVGKILRHGYESWHPDYGPSSNRCLLERELGHVKYAVKLLKDNGDIDYSLVIDSQELKDRRVQQFLHHQEAKR